MCIVEETRCCSKTEIETRSGRMIMRNSEKCISVDGGWRGGGWGYEVSLRSMERMLKKKKKKN